ncbi:hypothetical protein MBLNU459_g1459t3 [Dothideomycetes sp. NU459]
MSWMDWGSRPKKSAATPPPLYLVHGSDKVPYCHTCGRVIGSRKSQSAKSSSSEVKYCSERCKRHKLRPQDHRIEAAFAALLHGLDAAAVLAGDKDRVDDVPACDESAQRTQGSKGERSQTGKGEKTQGGRGKKSKAKGDPRIVVTCDEVEELVFGSRADPEKVFGRKKNRARRGVPDGEVWKSVDMEGSDTDPGSVSSVISASLDEGGVAVGSATAGSDAEGSVSTAVPESVALRIRPPQSQSSVNGSIGGEKGWAERIEETPEMLQKRREGQRKAEEREMVRSAARRAVVFGLQVIVSGETGDSRNGGGKRLCEALMNGTVVEPSYAKGNWAIRWREE